MAETGDSYGMAEMESQHFAAPPMPEHMDDGTCPDCDGYCEKVQQCAALPALRCEVG